MGGEAFKQGRQGVRLGADLLSLENQPSARCLLEDLRPQGQRLVVDFGHVVEAAEGNGGSRIALRNIDRNVRIGGAKQRYCAGSRQTRSVNNPSSPSGTTVASAKTKSMAVPFLIHRS